MENNNKKVSFVFLLMFIVLFVPFISANQKDMSKFSGDEVFAVSDASWKTVFQLVPVTTWAEGDEVVSYPLLFYSKETHNEYKDYSSIWENTEDTVQVTASSYYNEATHPRFAADDSIHSSWNSGAPEGPESWLKVDMGRSYSLDFIRLVIYSGFQIKLEISEDDESFETIFEGEFNDDLILSGFSFERRGVRVIKVTFFNEIHSIDPDTGEISYEWCDLVELEAYDSTNPNVEQGFDADSSIHFMQMYKPNHVTMVGENEAFYDLLIAGSDFGAGIKSENISVMDIADYLDFWEDYDSIFLVEENYKLGMMASVYASEKNSPLIFSGVLPHYPPEIYDNKYVYLIGNVVCPPNARECESILNVEHLQLRYVEETGTKNVVLVNPLDWAYGVELFQPLYSPKKSSQNLGYVYTKQSLAAPILAAGRRQLIVFSELEDIESDLGERATCHSPTIVGGQSTKEILDHVNRGLMDYGMKYLTIVASPQAIPDSVNVGAVPGYGAERRALDSFYGHFLPNNVAHVGRIYGLTSVDIPSYIARSLFYDELKGRYYGDEKTALMRAISPDLGGNHFTFAYLGKVVLSDDDFETECYLEVDRYSPLCEQNTYPDIGVYEDKQLYSYWDHGSYAGHGGLYSNQLPDMALTFVYSNACSTNTFYEGRDVTFGPRVLRAGSMAHYGSEGVSTNAGFISTVLANQFLGEGYSLGEISSRLKASEGLYRSSYIFIGDPMLKMDLDFDYESECSDGIDNDGNGFIDFGEDNRCESLIDASEFLGPVPRCSNGGDDDNDGLVDYPDDPDCVSIYDDSESQEGKRECQDGIDNDNDGNLDMEDEECISVMQNSESEITYECSDGIDNNGDGLIDFGEDYGCSSPYGRERSSLSCYDGIDNNENGLIDFFDPVCLGGDEHRDLPVCMDCVDNDGDGLVDLDDGGCNSAEDLSEAPDCSDGIDNDNDGFIDYPDDPHCTDSNDNAEVAGCADGIDNDNDGFIDYLSLPLFLRDYGGCISMDDDNETDMGACRDGIDNDNDGLIDVDDGGCLNELDPSEEYECSDGIDNNGNSAIDYPNDAFCLSVQDHSEFYDCYDGIDNDNDGFIDYPEDPGCESSLDGSELVQCQDGIDNDNDGNIDMEDVNCLNWEDDNEWSECSDGKDNDGDFLVDYLLFGGEEYRDFGGCISMDDDNETDTNACQDGIDNDNDGFIDLEDSGCFNENDSSEQTECEDGIDNDGNGLIDLEDIAKCYSLSDHSEVYDCADGLDNDGDGDVDYSYGWPPQNDDYDPVISDSGCYSSKDWSEGEIYECNDTIDNDNDGFIDYPEDEGCLFEFDYTERKDCSDGIDNDNDGNIDLEDEQCDDAENASEQVACRNRLDDDGDGFIDLEDVGCDYPFYLYDDDENNPLFYYESIFDIDLNEYFNSQGYEFELTEATGDSAKLVVNPGTNNSVVFDFNLEGRVQFYENLQIKAVLFHDGNTVFFIKEIPLLVNLIMLRDEQENYVFGDLVILQDIYENLTARFLFRDLQTNEETERNIPHGNAFRRLKLSEPESTYLIYNLDDYYSDVFENKFGVYDFV